ncbi:putative LPS assembly protein LptD [Olivibacter sitiensis]|uniref:putative LPS assembly protein LptD n=1 Tax=Olivibacter sitiensis TaxID=376470 RepID=UPI000414710F|nr:putative LPS assembly protein LptD [Olivibacter sitiensis]
MAQQLIVGDSVDILKNRQDTVPPPRRAVARDSTSTGITAMVQAMADDSNRMDKKNNIAYFYGNAKVKYESFELTADYIMVDYDKNLLFASGLVDHNGKYRGRPIFKDGAEAPISVDSVYYNFESRKGRTFNVFTEMDGSSMQAEEVKRNEYGEQSIRHGFYSTCNLPYPHTHFGFRISRAIVTDKLVVAGPSYIEFENVPVPFPQLPFGFFPKTNKRSSGFLFPSFGEDYTRGFFARDGGWYFAINDYWDTEVRGTWYTKGSWEANTRVRYKKNYKYDGGFTLRYASTNNGVEGSANYTTNKDFNITWNHSQRQEANPGTSFTASVNVGTGSYFQNTAAGGSYNYEQISRRNMNSSIAYGKVFADGKLNFTSSFSHRQDISSGTLYLQLPTFALNATSFNPFDSKDRVGEQKWYQRINMGYSMQGSNTINTTESELFKSGSLQKFQNGIQQNIPINLSLNVMQYFQFNTSVNYTERWYLQSVRRWRENTPGGFEMRTDTVRGFNRAYDYSMSSGFSTKVYSMGQFNKGKVAAIRHVITPSVNLNYRPDFSDPKYGFYRNYIDASGVEQKYSIFEGAVYGGPGAGRSFGIGFSVDNNVEAKVRTKSDTANAFKKIPILQGLTFSGNYNMVADSFKLSNISMSGRTALFDQKLGLNFNGTFDPYSIDPATGRRVNRFAIKDGSLARLTNFGISTSFSFNPKAAQSRNDNLNELDQQRPNMTPEQQQELSRISSDPNAFVDFNIPWNVAASFNFQYSKSGLNANYTSTININGDLNVTPKWKVQYNSGYDFIQKKISLTQLSIYRDLHCWDMSFSWIPFGMYRSYTFNIKVKASILQDLKLNKRNDYYNSF